MLSIEDFKNIFDGHFDAVRSYVFYRFGDFDAASDVAQDVFMMIWEKKDDLNIHHIKPLLYKMATDRAISSYRKQQNRLHFEQCMTPVQEPTSEYSPEDELSFSELAAAYACALTQMPEKQRVVFLMSREEGMKYAEISDCLQISVKAVEKHINAALRFLRTKLL